MRHAFRTRFALIPVLVLAALPFVLVHHLVARPPQAQQAARSYTVVPAVSPFIDVQSHPQGAQGGPVPLTLEKAQLAIDDAIKTSMPALNEVSLIFVPPPMMLGDPATFDS